MTKTTTITVTPGAPPAADVVRITKASWKKGLLTIEATSTNPNAILSVYGSTGSFMFTLTNKGGGKYSDQRGFIFSPERITVRSNFGGSASAKLTLAPPRRQARDRAGARGVMNKRVLTGPICTSPPSHARRLPAPLP